MKKIFLFLLISIYTLSLQAQTPELCNESKNTISVTSTTVIVIDSVALPSTEIGNFTTTTPPPPSDNKVVVLLHGLAGSSDSWAKARVRSLLDYKIRPSVPTYTQEFDVLTGFPEVHEAIDADN